MNVYMPYQRCARNDANFTVTEYILVPLSLSMSHARRAFQFNDRDLSMLITQLSQQSPACFSGVLFNATGEIKWISI